MIKKLLAKINDFIEKNRLSGIIIAVISFIVIVIVSLTDVYKIFELTLYDFRFNLKPSLDIWHRLTFVDIDDNSINAIGEFPWTRDKYAVGLKTMKDVGAAQVNMDVIFPDESPRQVNKDEMKVALQRIRSGGAIGGAQFNRIVTNNDRIFADAVKDSGNVILIYQFGREPLTKEEKVRRAAAEFKRAKARFIEKSSVPIPEKGKEKFQSMEEKGIVDITYPIPPLMQSAKLFGFSDRDIDEDGGFRKIRLIRVYNGRVFFNLALVMLMDICNVDMKNAEIVPGRRIVLKNAFNPMTHDFEDITIPIDKKGMMYVNWTGKERDKDNTQKLQLNREDYFNVVPYSMLMDYRDWVDVVYNEFELYGASTGANAQLGVQYSILQEAIEKYRSAKTGEERRKQWKVISETRNGILNIKREMMKMFRADVEEFKKQNGGIDDPGVQNEIKLYQDRLKAMERVIFVEGLTDNLLLTGYTATGKIDVGKTPINHEYPRVGIYHNTVNTILQGEYIYRVGSLINYIIILAIALGMGFLVQQLSARQSLIIIGSAFLVINVIVVTLFALLDLWVDQMGISLSVLLPSLTIAASKLINEESQKRFIKSAFSRYLSPGVIDQIIDNPESLELGGEDREITIFFSDVASFSTISEKLSAKQLVSLLNEYLSEMTDIILQHSGTIDKYEGDAIMAFYGAPHHFKDHAVRACMAAIDMKKRLRELQEHWRKVGKDELKARMGMNSGNAVVGNMGSKTRMDYTAMGDSVNLASRLEGANKYYSTHAMISESTYKGVGDKVEVRELDIIRVVGKTEPVRIYELFGRKGTLPDKIYAMLEKYNDGLEHFRNREWKRAKALFTEGLKIVDDDGPCQTYIDRCSEYMKKPPSKNWDGVYILKAK